MSTAHILLLLGAVISNTILAYSLARKTDRTGIIISFIIFLLTINLWAIPQLIINSFGLRGDLFTFVNRISAFGYVFIPVTFLTFTYAYINKLDELKKLSNLFTVFTPSFVFLFLSLTTNLIVVHRSENTIISEWGLASPPGLLFPIFIIWIEAIMFFSLLKLVAHIRESGRRQALLIVFALLIPLTAGTVTDGILPILGFNPLPMAIPLATAMAIIIGYAIQRYQLFEFSPSTILSSIGEGIVTVNERGRIILINKAAEVMLGQKSKDLVGQYFYKKIKLLDQFERIVPEKERPITKVIKARKRASFKNYYIVPKNGKKFSAAFTVSPISRGKKIIGATVSFRDNSTEQEVEKNKDEFISIASHEIKTPITALKLYTQLLERQISQNGNKKELSSLSKINKQTDRLVNLVGDLLNVSRIQTGKLEYNKKEFSLQELVDDVTVGVKPIVKGRKITKKGSVREKIYGDQEKLSQVLINLVTNAIKYSPKDSPIVLSSNAKNGMAILSVKDFGPGIPKKDRDKIFDRFYQGRSGKKDTGLGVGLYLSKEIVRNHDGELFVKSQRGKGTTFSFTLPIYKA